MVTEQGSASRRLCDSNLTRVSVLDFTELTETLLEPAVIIFNDLHEKTLLPSNEARRDEFRHPINRRLLIEIIGLDDKSVEELGILRQQWCSKPTVTSTRKTGPPNQLSAPNTYHGI